FFIGGVAIAVGTFTYGKKVMLTVGEGISEMSPVAALVAVLANALVLFLFASQGLESFLLSHGLPAFPLVPVSSSQAIVGSVIGIGLIKRGRGIRWRVLGEITAAWVVTPIAAIVMSFIALFFLQNVFQQKTYVPVEYRITAEAEQRIQAAGIPMTDLSAIRGKTYPSAYQFQKALDQRMTLNNIERSLVMSAAEIDHLVVVGQVANRINDPAITGEQKQAVQQLRGKSFMHRWELERALAEQSQEWQMKPNNKQQNEELRRQLDYVYRLIRSTGQ
ncbi:MAG: inorganic phosphate transporter, partial [Syntrophales bacterium]|nr:inorganic phosphate transporter [Syntrophales bacterium]